MSIANKTLRAIQELVPDLKPQPYLAQLENTIEFEEAETKYQLKVVDVVREAGLIKIKLMKGGEGPYYETLWAHRGRPYVRINDKVTNKLVDVFLLPPR